MFAEVAGPDQRAAKKMRPGHCTRKIPPGCPGLTFLGTVAQLYQSQPPLLDIHLVKSYCSLETNATRPRKTTCSSARVKRRRRRRRRFTIPKTPEDLRICVHCNLNSVENEMHIIFQYDLYNDLRRTLFTKYIIYKLQHPG